MAVLSTLVHHPRRLWLRRALFQIHLWSGVLLSAYMVAIALSGSVLVFKDELTRWALPNDLHPLSDSHLAPPASVVVSFEHAEPGGLITNLQFPSPVLPAFLIEAKDAAGRPLRFVADPVTAALQPSPRTWLDVTHDLHYYLLLPPGWGMQANAVGAAGLLLLALSGLVLWWPGLKTWTRGLRINLRARWRRINYDIHSAIGFWTLAIVLWWAISGVYFGFYRQVTAAVALVSPVRGMQTPAVSALPPPAPEAHASLDAVLHAAQAAAVPGARLWSISDPSLHGPESYVLLDRRAPGDFSHRDIVRVRTADARVLSVWHYGERHSLADWILWSMHPLHFGTLWGTALKIVWALLGFGLAVLTITGLLMYWNRYLRRQFAPTRGSSS